MLLQKDYKLIVTNNNFNNPKQVYEIIYKVYKKQFSINSDLLKKLFIETIASQNFEFLNILFKRFSNSVNRTKDTFLIDLFKESLLTDNFILINFLLEKLPEHITFENIIDTELIINLMKLGLIEIADYLFEKLNQNTINEIINHILIANVIKLGSFSILDYLFEKMPQDRIREIIDYKLISHVMKLGLIEVANYLFEKVPENVIWQMIDYELIADVMKLGLIEVANYLFEKLAFLQNPSLSMFSLEYDMFVDSKGDCENFRIILESYYKYRDNPFSTIIFNYIINDENISRDIIIEYAIINNDIDTVMLFLNDITKGDAFLAAIRYCNEYLVKNIFNNFSLEENIIEKAIMDIKYCPNILQLLLNSKRYNSVRLIDDIIEYDLSNDYSLPIMDYILTNFKFTHNVLKSFLMKSVEFCYLAFFDVLIKKFNVNLLFNNIVEVADIGCLDEIIDKMITDKNYLQILKNFIMTYKSPVYNGDYDVWKKDKLKRLKILSNLLKSKYSNHITRTNKNIDTTLSISFENLLDEEIVLVLNILNPLNIEIVEKYLLIACRIGYLTTIDKLIDYPVRNINHAFNVALSQGQIVAAAMVSNINMCNYLNDKRVKLYIKDYIKNKSLIHDSICESLIYDIASKIFLYVITSESKLVEDLNQKNINRFISKYSTYITKDFIDNFFDDEDLESDIEKIENTDYLEDLEDVEDVEDVDY